MCLLASAAEALCSQLSLYWLWCTQQHTHKQEGAQEGVKTKHAEVEKVSSKLQQNNKSIVTYWQSEKSDLVGESQRAAIR